METIDLLRSERKLNKKLERNKRKYQSSNGILQLNISTLMTRKNETMQYIKKTLKL
jgi:hypothetical protein